jgi:hypothetical protein
MGGHYRLFGSELWLSCLPDLIACNFMFVDSPSLNRN